MIKQNLMAVRRTDGHIKRQTIVYLGRLVLQQQQTLKRNLCHRALQ